jgi:hypothetical protein
MPFELKFTSEAKGQLCDLEHDDNMKDLVKLKRVRRCLALLQTNPKHPGLNSHKYGAVAGVGGEDVWECYVETRTSAAWRVFWHYGPGKGVVTVIAITPHP